MAIANIKKAVMLSEQQIGGGKVKGYRLYGKLSSFTLTGVKEVEEKVKGGGVYAIFYPKVAQHIKGQEYHEGMAEDVAEVNGSFLMYISSDIFLGKDVYVDCTKATSISRLNRDNWDCGAILTWSKRKGSDQWEIKPSKVSLITQKIARSNDLKRYINFEETTGEVYFTRSVNIEAVEKIEWIGYGKKVSSAPIHLQVSKRTVTDWRIWQNQTYTRTNPDKAIGQRASKLKLQLNPTNNRQGNYITKLVSKIIKNRKKSDEIMKSIIENYLQSCLEHWDAFGKANLYDFFDKLDDIATTTTQHKAIRDVRYKLSRFMPFMPEDCYKTFIAKSKDLTTNRYTLAVLIIAHIAGVSLSRVLACLNRIVEGKDQSLIENDGVTLAVMNPYALMMLGAGLRYEDCIKLSATLRSDTIKKEPFEKYVVYAFNCYKQYTKESEYRDTLISEDEWISKEADFRNTDIIKNNDALLYFNRIHGLTANNIESFTPQGLTEKPDIKNFKPITEAMIPLEGYFKPQMHHLLEKMINSGLVFQYKGMLIPTYEAHMEGVIMRKLYNNRKKYQLVMSLDHKSIVEYIDKHITDNTYLVSDSYIKNEKLRYRHRPAYIEPTYLSTGHKHKNYLVKSDLPVKYIVSDIDSYSLWEVATLLDSVKKDDTIIFIAEGGARTPEKGVSVLPLMKKCLNTINIGITEQDYHDYALSYNKQFINDFDRINDNVIYGLHRNAKDFSIKRAIGDDFWEEIDRLANKNSLDNIQIVTAGNNLAQKVNDAIVKARNKSEEPLFYIKEKPFYQNDKVIYTGITDTSLSRYEIVDKNGVYFQKVETTGLSRRHTATLIGAIPAKTIRYEDKPKMKYGLSDVVVILGIHDSILDKDVFLLFMCRRNPSTLELDGLITKNILHGYAQDIKAMARQRSDKVVFAIDNSANICRQDISAVISKADRKVTLIGDCDIQKSAFGVALEVVYPEQRRVLFSWGLNTMTTK